MMRNPLIRVTILALATLVTAAGLAVAQDKKTMPNWGGSVFIFGRDSRVAAGLGADDLGVLGLGYEMTGRLGKESHYGWAASFAYGIGNDKITVTSGGSSSENELSLSHYEVRLGFDYWDDCCDEDWFCGPGIVYESTKPTFKSTGSPDQKFKATSVIGLEPRAGGAFKLGQSARMFGAMSYRIGRASYTETIGGVEYKQSSWTTGPSYRGGLRFNY